jgi:hypothetical protein
LDETPLFTLDQKAIATTNVAQHTRLVESEEPNEFGDPRPPSRCFPFGFQRGAP